MLVLLCPGQGSQSPGFLQPWLELPGFADRLRWLGAVAGMDLLAHGTTSDAETIRDTAVAQPLIVAGGLAALPALFPHPADTDAAVAGVAGHSVGEVTAAAVAGVLSHEQAVVLVRERGRAMAEASAVTPTGMSAVVGGDPDDVAATLARHGLTPANVNGAGQVVTAGTTAQLAALREDPPARARVMPLPVAGAFHTSHMAPAVDLLAGYARALPARDARTRLLSNADGRVVHDGRDVLDRLVRQVANPVRWDLCQQTLTEMGVTGVIELPPAGTLSNLAKRAMQGVQTLALRTPADLDAAADMIAEHGGGGGDEPGPTWRLVVSPAKGSVRRSDDLVPDAPGSHVGTGDTVARVEGTRERHDVVAPHGGQVVEWLVEDGDPVSPGQPILRLHPTGA